MIRRTCLLALLLSAVGASLGAFAPLVPPQGWAAPLVAGVGAAAAVLLGLRAARGWVVWPTPIALLAGAWVILAVDAGPTGRWFVVPNLQTLRSVWPALADGAATLRESAPPVAPGAGVALIVAGVVLVLFVAVEALTIGADAPALGGLPLLLLWAPPVALGSQVPTWSILVALGAYLAILAISGLPPDSLRRAGPVVAGAVSLSMLAMLILSPWALSYPAPAWLAGAGTSSSTRLDLGLDVREDLVRGANTPLLRYTGVTPRDLGPLHSHTLSDFDGQQWVAADDNAWVATTNLLPEGSRSLDLPGSDAPAVTFSITDLQQDRLLLPHGPRLALDPVTYDPFQDEAHSQERGQVSYTLLPLAAPTTAQEWHERSLAELVPREQDRYLEVPQTAHSEQIADLTAEITSGAESPYEKAVAIQNFLRTDSRFEYTTEVPRGPTGDAVWDFLSDGQGYCVQFATAMVIMARSAGIPARMAVGFLPGEPVTGGGQVGGVIRSHDAHTWPQLFLGSAGWVRFEPTPAARTGSAPAGTEGLAAAQEEPEVPAQVPTTDPTLAPTAQPEAPVTQEPAGSAPTSTTDVPAWPFILTAAILGALAVALSERRRSRLQRERWGVDDYWDAALRALGPAGVRPLPSQTPNQILDQARHVARADGSTGNEAPGVAALEHLTSAVTAYRYAPASPPPSPGELTEWVGQVQVAAASWKRASPPTAGR